MKTYRALFEQYCKGTLADDKIAELDKILTDIYFNSPEELTRDEFHYAEDLIFESYSRNLLDDRNTQKFRENIEKDKLLNKKYELSRNLMNSSRSKFNGSSALFSESEDNEGENEEDQLKSILPEVFEKVRSEEAKQTFEERTSQLLHQIRIYFSEFLDSFILKQPNLKLAMVMVSVTVVAIVLWITNYPPEYGVERNRHLANSDNKENTLAKTGKVISPVIGMNTNKIPEVSSPSRVKTELDQTHYYSAEGVDEQKLSERIKRAALSRLAKSFFIAFGSFEVAMTRGENNSAMDSLIDASRMYNMKAYDSCIIYLNNLMSNKSFEDPEIFNEMNFYLGNCYLSKAFKFNSGKYSELALRSFEKIDAKSIYFNDSKWYSALVLIKMGKEAMGINILDTLLILSSERAAEVKLLRNQVEANIQ
jgi:hypothetical protein